MEVPRSLLAMRLLRVPDPRELVEAAMAGMGARSQTDLANEFRYRYGLGTTQSTISNWVRYRHLPEYEPTIILLDLAGWLNIKEERENWRPVGPIAVAEDMVRRLNAGERVPLGRLEQAADETAEAARHVSRLSDRLREAARAARSGS